MEYCHATGVRITVPPYSDIAAGEYDRVPADFPMITHEQTWPAELYGAIFFAVSNNRWNYRDISHAGEVIGYEPQDSSEVRLFQP